MSAKCSGLCLEISEIKHKQNEKSVQPLMYGMDHLAI